MSKIKMAITGSIGSGKTTVCDYIKSKGFNVFDCDKVNANLLEEGNLGYFKVKETFPEVFDGSKLNKAELALIVFNDKEKKKKLEDILHPLILEEMNTQMSNCRDVFIAEVPLLFESNWDKYFDYSILVVSDRDIALNRLLERGVSNNEAINRLNNQMSIEDKKKRSSEIIYNNSDLCALYKEVDKLLLKYVR